MTTTNITPLALPPVTVDAGPPTAHIAAFANYPVRYCLTDKAGHHRLSSGSSVEALLNSPWRRQGGVRIIAEHIAPDDARVVTERTAGGGWDGMCGSTCWIPDPDDEIKQIEGVLAALGNKTPYAQTTKMDPKVARTQYWWITGRRNREEHGWDGFRVQCSQRYQGHTDLCGVNDWVWDARARTPISKDDQ